MVKLRGSNWNIGLESSDLSIKSQPDNQNFFELIASPLHEIIETKKFNIKFPCVDKITKIWVGIIMRIFINYFQLNYII